MIQIIPAILIYGNKVARLNKGNINDISLFDESPLDAALHLESGGIKRIHLIDLEGVQKGRVVNLEELRLITGYTELSVDFGGGVTDDDDVRIAFEYGASTIHAASIAAKNRALFSSWIISYGRNKIILSADAIHGKVVTRGWGRQTEIDLMELIEYYHNQGIMYLKCMDIATENATSNPSIDLYNKILNKFPSLKIIACGGITTVDDIQKLQDIGVYGVVFSKALQEGKIKLEELKKFLI
jgi:phosphoribosylformimino-5-aminoimidazole carboxamide ribotide isomerase